MTIYKVVKTCELFGSQYDAGGWVGLTEDQERNLKVGKFSEEIPDQKALKRDPTSKAKVKVGNQNLRKASASEVEGLEGTPMDDGMILYPPQINPVKRGQGHGGGIHATTFQVTR